MFKPLLRLSIMATIWLKFRKQIGFALLLIISISLIQFIYNDVVRYLETAEQTAYLGYVLLAKWIIILSIIFSYLIYLKKSLNKTNPNIQKSNNGHLNNTADMPSNNLDRAENDPFSQIRAKKSLRSRGDLLIEKNNRNNP